MNIACILAGGNGLRMGEAHTPKQYRVLGGKPVLLWSLLAFDACADIDLICLVAHENWHDTIAAWARDAGVRTPLRFALPGEQRVDSAYAALCAIADACAPQDIVLFHDAARPLLSARLIEENLTLCRRYGSVYTALPSQDTVLISEEAGTLAAIPPREQFWMGQTPQTFRYDTIRRAHEAYRTENPRPTVTDDCSLVHRLGEPITLFRGEKRNLKLTTEEDLILLEALIAAGDVR